ncbi:WXG100 family type VII secretion target [Cryobacterium sp. Sr8]|uniref:WXG100 family type VII secretion target n=1 Tax=Cryobacterium sp. Sr8 TaxID=1259203 RepID=UPI00106C5966|nr:WXG100 family type VII secretion target [Cryobacterium sp. Sr8]TFD80270.1 WXG100 family type VII secretion target [Cryobacterium sp. Sr8]
MTSYQVDSEAVLSTTATARASIARIQAEVAGLLAQLTGLEGSWTGQAAAAFQGAVADWRATQRHVEESAEGLNLALSQAGRQYADVEQANARLFSR